MKSDANVGPVSGRWVSLHGLHTVGTDIPSGPVTFVLDCARNEQDDPALARS